MFEFGIGWLAYLIHGSVTGCIVAEMIEIVSLEVLGGLVIEKLVKDYKGY